MHRSDQFYPGFFYLRALSLNPYSNGCTGLTLLIKLERFRVKSVLILILMDAPVWRKQFEWYSWTFVVLILILMDAPVWQKKIRNGGGLQIRLNPYSNGCTGLTTPRVVERETTVFVLILILMDAPVWHDACLKTWKIYSWGLNPYSNGCTGLTP